MFDNLTEKFDAVFKQLRGRGRLTEDNIQQAMREVRLALLEADVNFKVVKDFVAAVRERAVGHDVLQSLTPGQQVVQIVRDELGLLMGAVRTTSSIWLPARPFRLCFAVCRGRVKPPPVASWRSNCARKSVTP